MVPAAGDPASSVFAKVASNFEVYLGVKYMDDLRLQVFFLIIGKYGIRQTVVALLNTDF